MLKHSINVKFENCQRIANKFGPRISGPAHTNSATLRAKADSNFGIGKCILSLVKLLKLIVISLVLSMLPNLAFADTIEACRIPDSKWSQVSLGFPVKRERLKYVANPKVLVIPFHPSDAPHFTFGATEKANFLQSANDIKSLSSGLSQISFIFNPTIQLSMTTSQLDKFKTDAQKTYLKDFENDQFGFAYKFLQEVDSTIDFSEIDSVVLYGISRQSKEEIASALQYTDDLNFDGNRYKRKDGKPWFTPIETNEKIISNVVLMYNRSEVSVITHELLHNYGLTDLYGHDRAPFGLSRMASNVETLLTYEKWVLGWHSEENVTCISQEKSQGVSKIVLDVRNKEQIVLLRLNQSSVYVVETLLATYTPILSFYKLNNDARPPIEYFSYSNGRPGVRLSDISAIGSNYQGEQFTLLIHSIENSVATLYIYPNSLSSSSEVQILITEAKAAAEKTAAELKAKQEAEAKAAAEKAAAELKAKQEAEAKAKAKQEAEAEAKANAEAEAKAKAKAEAAKKKTTIVCVKGKLTKKITGVNPKCPSGYKKK
jgi:hypothetical protein